MFFLVTKSGALNVEGNLPLTANEALTYIEKANSAGHAVEVRDRNGFLISLDQLRREAKR